MKIEKRHSVSILVRVMREGLWSGFEKKTVNKFMKLSNNVKMFLKKL